MIDTARGRRVGIAVAATVGLGLAVILGTFVGARDIPPPQMIEILLGGGTPEDAVVIWTQRLPRTLVGALVGMSLGAAGALMQGHTRNALADPGLFGVNAGAAFGVVLLTFAFDIRDTVLTTVAALIGALVVSAIIMVAGIGRRRGTTAVALAVFGMTLSTMLAAVTTIMILLDRDSLEVARFWEVGSITATEFTDAALLVGLLTVGLLLGVANAFGLNSLALGDDVAASHGTDVRVVRIVGLTAIALLAGGATAVAGPIAFVGLVVPHLARRLAGHDYRWMLPLSALLGGILLLLADVAGRVWAGGTVPVGVTMVLLGSATLVWLVQRRRLAGL